MVGLVVGQDEEATPWRADVPGDYAATGEQAVTIRLQPQDAEQEFSKREEQGMLALIKGNIN